MEILLGAAFGLAAWAVLRLILMGVYTVDQNERAVKVSFGRAVRVPGGKTTLDDPMAEALREDERARYNYPQVRVIQPGIASARPICTRSCSASSGRSCM
jgi:hypothetical protein